MSCYSLVFKIDIFIVKIDLSNIAYDPVPNKSFESCSKPINYFKPIDG